MGEILDSLYRFFTYWPQVDRYSLTSLVLTTVGLVLGFIGLKVNRRLIAGAIKEGENQQNKALDELKRRIASYMNGGQRQMALLTTNRVRSIALSLQKQYECSVITDALMHEVLRDITLEVDDRFTGAALATRLELLEDIASHLRKDEPPLWSFALVDRLSAYKKSQPTAVKIIFLAVLVASLLHLIFVNLFLFALVLFFVLAEIILILSSVRANLYWKFHPAGNQEIESWVVRLLRPKRPRLIADFFLSTSVSNSRWAYFFWNNLWPGIWEHSIFMRHLDSWRNLDLMHEFRFDLARELSQQLYDLHLKQEPYRISGISPPMELTEEFVALCRRLWIVTGDNYVRKVEKLAYLDDEGLSMLRNLGNLE